MATYTENYNLTMPAEEDNYNVETFNENFETIDTLMSENEAVANEINSKIGTPTESGKTIFALLENNKTNTGLTAIKSIQYVTKTFSVGTTSTSIEIKKVEPANCIVFFERLRDTSSSGCNRVNYTLNATSISLVLESFNGEVGFWIIEFC